MKKVFFTFIILSAIFNFAPQARALSLITGCEKLKSDFESFGGSDIIPLFPEHCTVQGTMITVIRFLSALIGVIAVLMIMVGGFKYMTAAGNPEKATSGSKTVIYASLGLVVVILAYALVSVVTNFITGGGTSAPSSTTGGLPGSGTSESIQTIAGRISFTLTKSTLQTMTVNGTTVSGRSVKATLSGSKADLTSLCGDPTDNMFLVEMTSGGSKVGSSEFTAVNSQSYSATVSGVVPIPTTGDVSIDLAVCGTSLGTSTVNIR